MAREEAERARAAVERARQAQADYRHVAARAERLDREAKAIADRAAAVRAVLADREAAEAERRAARAAELAARFPDGPPRDAHHDGLAEQGGGGACHVAGAAHPTAPRPGPPSRRSSGNSPPSRTRFVEEPGPFRSAAGQRCSGVPAPRPPSPSCSQTFLSPVL